MQVKVKKEVFINTEKGREKERERKRQQHTAWHGTACHVSCLGHVVAYKPGFHRCHYSTHCDIFFDVNGAVYIRIPHRWFIVSVYDV